MGNVYLECEVTSKKLFYNLVRSFCYTTGRNESFHTSYLTNNQHRHLFYRDLYKDFSKVDKELANWVIVSISFYTRHHPASGVLSAQHFL